MASGRGPLERTAEMASVEQLRAEWRRTARSTLDWRKSPAGNEHPLGECRGEWSRAKLDGETVYTHAYLKPGKIGRQTWAGARFGVRGGPLVEWPLAAYEKVAADLAYEVICPVPVVQVIERDRPEYCSFAAV